MPASLRPLSRATLAAGAALLLCATGIGSAAETLAPTLAPKDSFLGTIRRQTLLSSTVPANGDQNPYAVVVAPVSAGRIHKDDVLITNFNNKGNLQGLGTSIVAYTPSTKQLSLFADLPRDLPGCPGGVGLTTAMTMLQSGWVIVGSLPSRDGTAATKGSGCLLVLNPQGKLAGTLSGPDIDGPWGNMAVVDRGDTATLFVSNTGFGVTAPGQDVVRKATVLRLELAIPSGGPPHVLSRTVVASGLGEQASRDVFMIGPTGLALGRDGTLYVSDAIGNGINAIDHALTRNDSAGVGRVVTRDGLLKRPLALAVAPGGHLIAVNGLDGEVVEIDPRDGRQVGARWVDRNRAQTPPGAGDLFGIAMTPSSDGFYFVEDEVNALLLAHRG